MDGVSHKLLNNDITVEEYQDIKSMKSLIIEK